MQGYIVVILSLLIMAIAYSAFMKKRIEVTLPLSIFTVILVIYVFGLFGKLSWGVYAFFGIAGIAFIVGFIMAIARREFKKLMGNIFTVGFFVFIAALVFIWFMTEGRLFSKFDEFTHWGLTVKNYIFFDGFANIKGSTTHGAGYQPGMSVFCYFFTALRGYLNESDTLRAMNVYIVAMLLPIFRKVTWKRVVIGIFMIPLIGSIPWLFSFAITPYNTLLTDAALSVTFAYLLFQYFTHGQNVSNYISLGLGSAVLILIKPSTEIFALAVFLLILIDVLAFKRKDFSKMWKNKGGWFGYIFYIVISIASYASWKIFTAANHMLQVFDYIEVTDEKAQDATTIIAHYIKELLSPTDNDKLNMAYVWWILIFACLACIVIILLKDKQDRKRTVLFSCLLIVGYIGFLAGLCFMYVFLFIPAEAATLASMDRYICSFLLGVVIFFVYLIIDAVFQRFGGLGNAIIVFLVALVAMFAPWSKINSNMIEFKKAINKTQVKREAYSKVEEILPKLDYKNDRVYFIAQDTNGLQYQTSYYLATPVPLSYDYEMGWSLGTPYNDKDIWTLDMSKKEWEKALVDGKYTHVYLFKVDQKFKERFGTLFKNQNEIDNDTCFEIKQSGQHIILEKALIN